MSADGKGRVSGMEAPSVLVVEDNAEMRALIRSLVEEVTARVEECGDGESAVALYPRLRPDFVLMDIRMGGLDGIAATREIRQLDPAARIIVVTESSDDGDRLAALDSGASAFLRKERLLDLPGLLRDLGRSDGAAG